MRTRQPLYWTLTFIALGAVSSAQTTWHVDVNSQPPGTGTALAPYASIQFAIDQTTTSDGDTLLIEPGRYAETLDLSKSLTLRASAPWEATGVDGIGLAGSVLHISGGAVVLVEDLTLQGGIGFYTYPNNSGGGLLVEGGSVVDLANCVIRDNTGSRGAGICVRDSTLRRTDVTSLKTTVTPSKATTDLDSAPARTWTAPQSCSRPDVHSPRTAGGAMGSLSRSTPTRR